MCSALGSQECDGDDNINRSETADWWRTEKDQQQSSPWRRRRKQMKKL